MSELKLRPPKESAKSARFRSRAGLKPGPYNFRRRILPMAAVLRSYDPRDFSALYRLDQSCFPAGISYSKTTLRYFLSLRTADCVVAMEDTHIAGFILTEENPPLAHVITLDVAENFRRRGIGSALLAESEANLA